MTDWEQCAERGELIATNTRLRSDLRKTEAERDELRKRVKELEEKFDIRIPPECNCLLSWGGPFQSHRVRFTELLRGHAKFASGGEAV